MTHRFFPFRELRQHESSKAPENILHRESYEADQRGAAAVRGGRPRRRDRRDARVPQGRARGALRALPDDGRRDRRRRAARRRGSGTASTRPPWGRGRCTCGSSGRPTGGPARGPPRSGGPGRGRGQDGGCTQDAGYERLRREEADAHRRRSRSRSGFMGPVFSAAFLDPVDRGVQRVGQGRGHRDAVRGAPRRDRHVRARLDRRAVREAGPRGRVALRLRRRGPRRPKAGAFGGWVYYGATTVLASAIAVPRRVVHATT